jgi:DNA-directed RNA polymerase specialized sigma24 family protein
MRKGHLYRPLRPHRVTWEINEWLTQLFDALPPAQREIMAMTVNGLATNEIADRVNKTPETVRKLRSLGRQRIKHLIGTESLDDAAAPMTCSRPTPREEAR